MKDSRQIRQAYLDFFAKRGHTVFPSFPLIPQGDATLMFNSAGMVPFKPYFLGIKKDLSRAASCQKCFRTTDIERVGQTIRHLTFFEMLGNFSFGDYFKQEAIAWAWEFLTKDMALDPKRLYPTVFKDDNEAFSLWTKMGLPNAPTRLGAESNFWDMGPTGPCGPCSEIYFDRGAQHSCGKPDCAVGCDCDRYLEIWNLVFTQFDRQADKSLKDLPRRNIDTGMGLERLALVVQGKNSPFETDLFKPLADKVCRILNIDPAASPQTETALRVISDHARASFMLIAEGIIPSNVDRGYVLRRIIRRAVRHGKLLGAKEPFLHQLAPEAVRIFGQAYPDLAAALAPVQDTLRAEEEKFLETLESGERHLNEILAKSGKTLPGDQAFKLYDTFGFPLELTREIAAARGITVDEKGFEKASEKAVEVARASWKGFGEKIVMPSLLTDQATEFTGYESLQEKTVVVAAQLHKNELIIVLEKTPFYPEGGGQVGDEGELLSADGKQVLGKVIDTQKQGTVILHRVTTTRPQDIKSGLTVIAKVDAVRRNYITPHHTGTHLLNAALRKILGTHVRQAGSYVGPDKLRFDFTHPKALGPDMIREIEAAVAQEIKKGDQVLTKVDSIAKVKDYGATTLLGEDYGAKPRFVLINAAGWQNPRENFSLELCGGTHVKNTAEIAAFKILKESSVAAGVRRIEALAGNAVGDYERLKEQEDASSAQQLLRHQKELLEEITALGGKADESSSSQRSPLQLRLREKELKELLTRLKSKKLAENSRANSRIIETHGLKLCLQRLDGADSKDLRNLADKAKSEVGSGLVFLACAKEGKLSFVLAATPDLVSKGYDASKIAKALASAHSGSAGGRAEFAQGGLADGDWEKLSAEVSELAARTRFLGHIK